MNEIKDRDGKIIKAGDTIAMPHGMDNNIRSSIIKGYYVTKVSHDKERNVLICDNGNEFDYAYNVVKLNK